MTPAGLLGTLSDWYERNKDRIYGGGVRGAATRGLLGVEAPQQMTPMQREVYENAVRIGAPALGAGKAIFIGAKAKSWNKEAAKRFEQLEKEGLSNREAFAQTGTFRGPDGQLRQEIDDSASRFDISKIQGPGPLDQLNIDHVRDLENAQAYKQLLIEKKTPRKAAAAYKEKFGEAPSDMAIFQASNFDSPRDISYEVSRLKSRPQTGPRPTVGESFHHPSLMEAYSEIAKETRIGRLPGTDPGLFGRFDPDTNRVELSVVAGNPRSMLLHELQHTIQQREGFAKGGGADLMAGGMEKYRRLAGEAEARAVEKRMDYTPQQRRAVFPLEDYDVPLDQLILRGLLAQ